MLGLVIKEKNQFFTGLIILDDGEVMLLEPIKKNHHCTSNCYDCFNKFQNLETGQIYKKNIKKFSYVNDAEFFIRLNLND